MSDIFTNEYIEEDVTGLPKLTENSLIRKTFSILDLKGAIWTFVIIITLSTLINSVVLKIYKERKKDANKRFVVFLAVVDIAACWILNLLSIAEALALELNVNKVFEVIYLIANAVFVLFVSCYTLVLLMWAIERLIAVACPFTVHEKLGSFRKYFGVLGTVCLIWLVGAGTVILTPLVNEAQINALLLAINLTSILMICSIVGTYLAIFVLIKKGDGKMAAKRGVGGEARQAAHSKRHKRAMKLGLSILILYLLSFTPLFIYPFIEANLANYIGRLYYINHIGNFFIYYATDGKFRRDFKSIIVKCCSSSC